MILYKFFFSLLLFVSLALTGCNENVAVISEPTELEGTWKTSCESTNGESYWISAFSATGNQSSLKHTKYLDSECTMPERSIVKETNFIISGDIILSTGVTAKEIDYQNRSDYYIPENDELTAYLNGKEGCNKKFETGVPMKYSECEKNVETNYSMYGIFRITQNRSLYLSSPNSFEESSRPTKLSDQKYLKIEN